MTSVTLPVIGLAVSMMMAVLVLVLGAVAGYCLWQLRRVVPRQIKLMEDTLKVYNSANATLGCRITELEIAVQRQHVAAPNPPQGEAVAPLRVVQSALERYESRAAGVSSKENVGLKPDPQPVQATVPAQVAAAPAPNGARPGTRGEFSESELRLAQLIKSRLSSLRVG